MALCSLFFVKMVFIISKFSLCFVCPFVHKLHLHFTPEYKDDLVVGGGGRAGQGEVEEKGKDKREVRGKIDGIG